MSSDTLESCIQQCLKKTEDIIHSLNNLEDEVENFHKKCNVAKTVGTSANTLGTVALVGSVFLAPFTGGASLLVGAAGMGATLTGTATNIVTDIVDNKKTKEIINELEGYLYSKKSYNEKLQKYIDDITKLTKELAKQKGITEELALQIILKGTANGILHISKDFAKTLKNALHVCNLTFMTESMALRSLPLISKTIGLTNSQLKFIYSIFGVSGKAGASVLKGIGRFAAVVSVIFTVVDIANLIKSWNNEHPTVEAIRDLRINLRKENENLKEFKEVLESLKDKVDVSTLETSKGTILVTGSEEAFDFVYALLAQDNVLCKEIMLAFKLKLPDEFFNSTKKIIKFLLAHALKDNVEYYTEALLMEIKAIVRGSGKKAANKIKVLLENLYNTLKKKEDKDKKEKQKKSKRGEHIINNGVLRFHRNVIDGFLSKVLSTDINHLRGKLKSDSKTIQDYDHPFSEANTKNISEVLKVFFEDDIVYIDVNAAMYGCIIKILTESCIIHMEEMYYTNDNFAVNVGSHRSAHIKTSVELINSSPLFVDFVALDYWILRGGNRLTYESAKHEVAQMFYRLYDNLRIWIKEFKKANK